VNRHIFLFLPGLFLWPSPAVSVDWVDNSRYEEFLQKFVKNGVVDCGGIKKEKYHGEV